MHDVATKPKQAPADAKAKELSNLSKSRTCLKRDRMSVPGYMRIKLRPVGRKPCKLSRFSARVISTIGMVKYDYQGVSGHIGIWGERDYD